MGGQLRDLRVLAIDCQATGATPEQGHLLELAWAWISAGDDGDPRVISRLLEQPEGEGIPPRVTAITGIDDEMLVGAQAPDEVWDELIASIESPPAVTAIHYARFERRFLVQLYAAYGSGDLPLDIVCTHELARRLRPGLPRLGLRALAGHLGHRLPEVSRAADHVRATACVWRTSWAISRTAA